MKKYIVYLWLLIANYIDKSLIINSIVNQRNIIIKHKKPRIKIKTEKITDNIYNYYFTNGVKSWYSIWKNNKFSIPIENGLILLNWNRKKSQSEKNYIIKHLSI